MALFGSVVGAVVGMFVGIPIPIVGSLIAAIVFAGLGAAAGAVLGESLFGSSQWNSSREIGLAAFRGRCWAAGQNDRRLGDGGRGCRGDYIMIR